jgi:hypothetical protein
MTLFKGSMNAPDFPFYDPRECVYTPARVVW